MTRSHQAEVGEGHSRQRKQLGQGSKADMNSVCLSNKKASGLGLASQTAVWRAEKRASAQTGPFANRGRSLDFIHRAERIHWWVLSRI